MNSSDIKNGVKSLKEELISEKEEIIKDQLKKQERLKFIDDMLSKLEVMVSGNKKQTTLHKKRTINKKKIILETCKNIHTEFSANDIKTILAQSENEEIRNIQIGYISAQLCRLADSKEIETTRKGTGKGDPNRYKSTKK